MFALSQEKSLKPTIVRDSNMELLRIISMILVIGLHVNYAALGSPTFDISNLISYSICRVLFQQICLVCVNIFVLISGWYGIKPSIKGVVKLLFQVFFIESVMLGLAKMNGIHIPREAIVKLFVVGSSYWFVPAYLILYCIAPAINSLFIHATKKEAGTFILSFFSLQFIFGYLFADMARFGNGYSALSFIGLYSLARFARCYPIKWFQHSPLFDVGMISIATLFSTFLASLFIYINNTSFAPQSSFNNPLVIIASLFWVLLFSKLHISSHLINLMGKSSFSIYLTHCQPLVFSVFIQLCYSYYTSHSFLDYSGIVFFLIICICFFSILLDQIRIFIWDFISRLFPDNKSIKPSV